MAIRKPYGANDVFASPEEARNPNATVADIPLDAFRESMDQSRVKELIAAARQLSVESDPKLPARLA